MNELQIFSNPQFGKVRAVEVDGKPWFCLADICKPLGLTASKCRTRLKVGGVLTRDTPTKSGVQKMLWVSEGNLYRAIFQSKKPEAEQFTDWVTEEVLPSLRERGNYSMQEPVPEVSLSGLANLIRVTRKIMLDMGATPQDIGEMAESMFETWNVPVPQSFERQLVNQVSLFDRPTQMLEN